MDGEHLELLAGMLEAGAEVSGANFPMYLPGVISNIGIARSSIR